MVEVDTLAYYNKLAQIRAAQPVISAVSYGVKQCDAQISGDAIYTYRCPAAWLAFTGVPNAQTVELIFPRSYFTWVKSYLQQALALRPGPTASAELRVIWALDCWAHVNFALFALPLPWSDIYSGGVGGVPELTLSAVAFGGSAPRSITGINAELNAWNAEKAAIEKSSSVKVIRDAATNSRLNPSPFAELAVQWVGAPGSRSPRFQQPNQLWPLLLSTMQPWSANWSTHWLASKGNKDAFDLEHWRNEPVMLRAAMQWRLWSAQEWGYSGFDPSFWPDGMGKANNVAALGMYIAHVRGEQTSPKIVFYGPQAYPNLAFGLEAVADHVRRTLTLNFDAVLQAHLDMWLRRSAPRVTADGALQTLSDGRLARQPITRTDYADYFKGLRKAVTDRARLALLNPALSCSPSDVECLKAAEYGAKVQAAIGSSPLAPLQNAMQRIADKLVTLLGGAIGGGYEPLFVLRDPFSRTFTAPGYQLVAAGSTADVFYRIALSVVNYKMLLPGLFTAAIAQSARVALKPCRVHWTRDGNPCEVCEGDPLPACAANVANLPPIAAASTGPAILNAADPAAFCEKDWAAFAATPKYKGRLTDTDKLMHDRLCVAVAKGTWSLQQGSEAWTRYLATRFPPAAPANLLATLTAGFLRASNPLR